MKLIKNIYYGKVQDEARMLDLYRPDAESFPVFVYFLISSSSSLPPAMIRSATPAWYREVLAS